MGGGGHTCILTSSKYEHRKCHINMVQAHSTFMVQAHSTNIWFKHIPQTWFKYIPQTWFKHIPPSWFKYIPQTWFKYIPQTWCKYIPQTWFKHIPQTPRFWGLLEVSNQQCGPGQECRVYWWVLTTKFSEITPY